LLVVRAEQKAGSTPAQEEESDVQYTLTWGNKFLTTQARTIGEMAQAVEDAAQELREMEREGVTLDAESGVEDDYARLVTTDSEVAGKYGFEEVGPEVKETNVITVQYNEDETGPAELISRTVARVVSTPIFGDLCRGSIVQLDRDAGKHEGIPQIVEVLYCPYPRRTWLRYGQEAELITLVHILRALGADSEAVFPPKGDQPGLLVVSHPEFVDPVLLAEAIGIQQPQEEDATA
jgi:hypothetical protein